MAFGLALLPFVPLLALQGNHEAIAFGFAFAVTAVFCFGFAWKARREANYWARLVDALAAPERKMILRVEATTRDHAAAGEEGRFLPAFRLFLMDPSENNQTFVMDVLASEYPSLVHLINQPLPNPVTVRMASAFGPGVIELADGSIVHADRPKDWRAA